MQILFLQIRNIKKNLFDPKLTNIEDRIWLTRLLKKIKKLSTLQNRQFSIYMVYINIKKAVIE